MPFSLQVKHKLIIFSTATMLPILILGYLLLEENVASTRVRILDSGSATARLLADSLDAQLEGTAAVLGGVAQSREAREQQEYKVRSTLANTLLLNRSLSNISILDSSGRPALNVIQGTPIQYTADSLEYLGRTAGADGTAVSDSLDLLGDSRPSVVVSVPMYDFENKPIGRVAATLSLGEMQRRLIRAAEQQRVAIMVVDSRGRLLLHPDWNIIRQGPILADWEPVRSALDGHSGVGEYRFPLSSEETLVAYTPIKEANWAVLVTYPTEVAYAPIQESRLRGSLYFLVAVLFAAGCATFFARQIANPVLVLTRRARDIEGGDLRGKVTIKTGDELEELGNAFNSMSQHMASHVAQLATTKEEIRRQASQLQALFTKMVSVQDEERCRIGADIHDGVVQLMVGLLYQIEVCEELLTHDPGAAADKLEQVRRLVNTAIDEIRRIIVDLHSPVLTDHGLLPAIQQYVSDCHSFIGGECNVVVEADIPRLPLAIEDAAYRIIQEALNNAWKHSEAENISLVISEYPKGISIAVHDDGCGFDAKAAVLNGGRHLGLSSMQERARKARAEVEVRSEVGQGTTVLLYLPIVGTPEVGPQETEEGLTSGRSGKEEAHC